MRASLKPKCRLLEKLWKGSRDSNSDMTASKTAALPVTLLPHNLEQAESFTSSEFVSHGESRVSSRAQNLNLLALRLIPVTVKHRLRGMRSSRNALVERLGVEPRLAVLQTAVQTRYTISRKCVSSKFVRFHASEPSNIGSRQKTWVR